jgi:Bacterial-like globin
VRSIEFSHFLVPSLLIPLGTGRGLVGPQGVLLATSEDTQEVQKATLYDRIGGEPALLAAVEGLYDRLVADEKLMKYFQGVDMESLKNHQYKFMEIAFTRVPEDLDIAQYLTQGHSRLWAMVRMECLCLYAGCYLFLPN